MQNNLENEIEINNNLEIEKEQKSFLETTLGKTINTEIDIGIRALLPDFIEEQIKWYKFQESRNIFQESNIFELIK